MIIYLTSCLAVVATYLSLMAAAYIGSTLVERGDKPLAKRPADRPVSFLPQT